ncbi:MAG TPA: DsbA family protein [Candidatus Binataceae bacterium]|jgi:2-hydroxychromene-2-carboxylate isomerase|nr:DsbA family protein [Candidatus Binataceae bacterium]
MAQSRIDPLASSAPAIVYIDFKSPYAYLAVAPTRALADELGLEIDWRPFNLDIRSYLGSARLDTGGRVVEEQRSAGQWARVRYAYHDVRRYAGPRVIRGTTKIWDSTLAGIGMMWAKQQGQILLQRYIDYVYERFWKRELDIEDLAVIEQVLIAIGADVGGFQAWARNEGRKIHDDLQRDAFEAGIFGVPTYVIAGERHFGREHLPRVRWLLGGRQGPPPDVAYEPLRATARTAGTPSSRALIVAVDFKNPYSYLALGPTRAMSRELGVPIDWRPFLVSPWQRRTLSAADDRATRHRALRSAYAEREVAIYADTLGVSLRGLYRGSNSTLAAIGLLWAKRFALEAAERFVVNVFGGYWREELDIEDPAAITSRLAEAGVPIKGFDGFLEHEGVAALERVRNELIDTGLFDVPAYQLDGEIYIGRQHLPTIRALMAAGNAARSLG